METKHKEYFKRSYDLSIEVIASIVALAPKKLNFVVCYEIISIGVSGPSCIIDKLYSWGVSDNQNKVYAYEILNIDTLIRILVNLEKHPLVIK